MNKNSKIFLAGHRGLVGSALLRNLQEKGYSNIVTRSHKYLDLADQEQVDSFFLNEKPEYVFLAAAKVGGIVANNNFPGEFIHANLIIQDNVIHNSLKHQVKKLLFLGSSCIYPRDCSQPIKEEYLLTGPLEPTNRPYAIAKIAGIETCWAYNRQYGTNFFAAMPTNLYGIGDNYDLENSHVLPALIRKMHEAKMRGDKEVIVWGSGSPFREFLYSDDLADACVYMMSLEGDQFENIFEKDSAPLINIGCGSDLTIRELVGVVQQVVGFDGTINWDSSKPDGTPRKLLNVDRLFSTGWRPKTALKDGIQLAYIDFLKTYGDEPIIS